MNTRIPPSIPIVIARLFSILYITLQVDHVCCAITCKFRPKFGCVSLSLQCPVDIKFPGKNTSIG